VQYCWAYTLVMCHAPFTSAPLPLFLGNSRRFLDLSSNAISGTIPKELSTLTLLNILALGDNKLTGNIPTQFTKLASLGASLSLFFPSVSLPTYSLDVPLTRHPQLSAPLKLIPVLILVSLKPYLLSIRCCNMRNVPPTILLVDTQIGSTTDTPTPPHWQRAAWAAAAAGPCCHWQCSPLPTQSDTTVPIHAMLQHHCQWQGRREQNLNVNNCHWQ
jgi:hypothetical protein